MAGLAHADDEGALCGLDHVVGDDGEVVDFHHSFDLGEEPFQEPEVAASDAGDCGDGLSVGEVFEVERLTEVSPMPLQNEVQFVLAEGSVLVCEADPAVELRVPAELLLQSWHADQDEADLVSVIPVAEELDGSRAEPLGLIDNDQFHNREGAFLWWLPDRLQVFFDAEADAQEDFVEFFLERARSQQHAGRVENGA